MSTRDHLLSLCDPRRRRHRAQYAEMDGLGGRARPGVDQFTGPKHPHSFVGRPPRCRRRLRLSLGRLRPQSSPASSSTSSGSESPPPSEERSTTTSTSWRRPQGAFSGTASTTPPRRCRLRRISAARAAGRWPPLDSATNAGRAARFPRPPATDARLSSAAALRRAVLQLLYPTPDTALLHRRPSLFRTSASPGR